VFRGILQGLDFMHQRQPVLCHNDLDPSNVILSEADGGAPVIIDLGHVSQRCSGVVTFDTSDLDILFHANENMVGIFDEQGDIFSACAILYYMLTGKAPWQVDFGQEGTYKEHFLQLTQYRKSNALDLASLNASDKVKAVLEKGLALKFGDRYGNVQEILSLLDSSEPVKDKLTDNEGGMKSSRERGPNDVTFDVKRGGGNGFKDIAGMQDLKNYLSQKVIFVIKNKEVAQEYKLVPPNGMLLYGPPGCGKTFFAEKFAEETGFNFILIKSSDLGSSFVHGSQEKISQLFKQAERNAPVVVCFDEFDALVPDRSAPGSQYVSSEVNEFLSQMNNCAQRGIFVVATSNRPDKIDPAILRTGRIDKTVYVPLPDFEARKEMFKLYLNQRPVSEDIDCDLLAKQTEGYIASDIAFIVNDSAMMAAYSRSKITMQLLLDVVKTTRPSVRTESLRMYDDIRQRMESTGRRSITERIGFIHYD
jgi:transitional endoplasmic reticulum ATPase